MRREIIDYLDQRPDLKYMIREQPDWYRKLSRNPASIQELDEEAKTFYGQTFGQRIDKLSGQIESISRLVQLFGKQ
ncbi:YlbE-like family protein [Pseudalkalibacillus berkeleyi]|uniref:YlbE-like family protein n=1 Tax=Pseudalkalibacillus berkeleyi TaxID=1069813 RepID=A0ABS9GVZ6_9BACL|nr:YlbE-like family protein [Pseudalkalibacillus berkeleyi]MCF6136982.1 YlbE-like family protein [Pseudalkalibacillus berkeleyi]